MNNDQIKMSAWLTKCEKNGIWVEMKKRGGSTISLKLRNVQKKGYDKWNIEKVRSNLFTLTYQGILIGLLLDETNNPKNDMNMFIYCDELKSENKSKAKSVRKRDRYTYDIQIDKSIKTPCLKF